VPADHRRKVAALSRMEFLQNTAEDLNDPDWGETSAEYFLTREEASTAGRAALDRLLKRRTS